MDLTRIVRLAALIVVILLSACSGGARPANDSAATRDTSAFIAAQLRDLATLPCPDGVTRQTWDELRAALRSSLEHRLANLQSGAHSTAAAPASPAAKTTLTWDISGPVLEWRYYNPGDYNQDGEVNISDLTPLASRLDQSPPPDTTDSIISVVDGDSNGVVTISDITPLGANLGNRVTAYAVYRRPNLVAYPEGNEPSTVTRDATIPFSAAVGEPNQIRLAFRPDYNLNTGDFFWVRPLDETDGSEGTVSNYLQGGGSHPNASFTVTQFAGEVPLVCGFNASNSSGVGALTFYWDLNGDGVFEWNGNDATVSHNFTSTGMYTVSLRVVDSLGYSDIATMAFNVNMAKAWKRYGLPVLDGSWDVDSLALGYLAGRPWLALGFHDPGSFGLSYFTADTPTGSAWSEVHLGFAGVTSMGHTMDSVLAANGPAVAWSKTDVGALYYSPALEPFGSGWDLGMVVMGDLLPITDWSMALVDGGPALLFYSESSDVMIYSAGDPTGTSWSAPQYVAGLPGSGIGRNASLAEISGRPAVAYFDPVTQAIYYVAWNGAAWGAPILAQGCQDCVMFDGLFALPDGSPAIIYHDKGAQFVHSARGTNATGAVWSSPAPVTATDGEADLVPRVVISGSQLHMFYYRSALDELQHSVSNIALGGWSEPDVVAAGIDGSVVLSCADLGGFPGVAYVNSAGEPRMAINY